MSNDKELRVSREGDQVTLAMITPKNVKMKEKDVLFSLSPGDKVNVELMNGKTVTLKRDLRGLVHGNKGQHYTVDGPSGSYRFNISSIFPCFEYPPNSPDKMFTIVKARSKDGCYVSWETPRNCLHI